MTYNHASSTEWGKSSIGVRSFVLGPCSDCEGVSQIEPAGASASGGQLGEKLTRDQSRHYDIKRQQIDPHPPLLIGGLIQAKWKFLGVNLDYLTITAGPSLSRLLQKTFPVLDIGQSKTGFKQTELRACIGGEVWRKFDPIQSSKKYGLNYESWDYSGAVADLNASWLACQSFKPEDIKPTRIDIAFNYSVPADYMSDHWMSAVQSHVESVGLISGCMGENGVYTQTVGSRTSPRFIRVYRKDLRDKYYAVTYGPFLRVEIVLKEERAIQFWDVFSRDREAAKRLAASHIYDMTGFDCCFGFEQIPDLSIKPATQIISTAKALLDQYSSFLIALQDEGIDINSMLEIKRRKFNRLGRSRLQAYRNKLVNFGKSDFVEVVKSIVLGENICDYEVKESELCDVSRGNDE